MFAPVARHLVENMKEKKTVKILIKSIFLMLALGLPLGCGEPNAKVNKPKQYSKDGLEFRYPGNWKVTEDVRQADLRYLIVETPGDAILVIQIIPDKLAVSLKEYAQVFSDNARKEMPIGKMTPSTFGVPQMAGGFEVVQGKCSISVLGVIIPHTRYFRRKQIGNEVCFLMSQAPSEDYLKVSTGFDQVINSFKYENLLE